MSSIRKESEILRTLKRACPEDMRFWRLETYGGVLGLPDLLYAGRGTGGLIELKVIHGKRTKSRLKVPYRGGQIGFLRTHAELNPHTFMLAYVAGCAQYALIGPSAGFPLEYEHGTGELLNRALWHRYEFDDEFFDVLTQV